jgi:hypothetical protein
MAPRMETRSGFLGSITGEEFTPVAGFSVLPASAAACAASTWRYRGSLHAPEGKRNWKTTAAGGCLLFGFRQPFWANPRTLRNCEILPRASGIFAPVALRVLARPHPVVDGFHGSSAWNCSLILSKLYHDCTTMSITIDRRAFRKLWRRGWDSNPRLSFPNTRFRGELFRPLRHLSAWFVFSLA